MAEQENGSSRLPRRWARVGDRWTLLVVEVLLGGPRRFNDLLGQVPGIAGEPPPSASSGWSGKGGLPSPVLRAAGILARGGLVLHPSAPADRATTAPRP